MTAYFGSIIIWKLEFQKRGAAHFHLMIITRETVDLGNYMIIKNKKLQFFDREEKRVLEKLQGVYGSLFRKAGISIFMKVKNI